MSAPWHKDTKGKVLLPTGIKFGQTDTGASTDQKEIEIQSQE
jgi:hypothetical protein